MSQKQPEILLIENRDDKEAFIGMLERKRSYILIGIDILIENILLFIVFVEWREKEHFVLHRFDDDFLLSFHILL